MRVVEFENTCPSCKVFQYDVYSYRNSLFYSINDQYPVPVADLLYCSIFSLFLYFIIVSKLPGIDKPVSGV